LSAIKQQKLYFLWGVRQKRHILADGLATTLPVVPPDLERKAPDKQQVEKLPGHAKWHGRPSTILVAVAFF
jgi:hypothetical protein